MKFLKVRNKNAMREMLLGGANITKIAIVPNLDQDEQTKEILALAKDRGIKIEPTPIRKMEKRRSGHSKEVIIAYLEPNNIWTLGKLIDDIYSRDEYPYFLLINKVDFESNIGVIARTAYAAGVNGLIFQGDEERFLNDETLHVSIGAIARIPLVKMNIFEAIKSLNKEGIKTFCLQMGGETYYKEDLSGPVAFVLGAEREGLSHDISKKCLKQISIPMKQGIDSLNVAVSAGIVLFEKNRQDLSR